MSEQSHLGRPGAMRTLDALVALGGSGTALQIEGHTRTKAAHSDVDQVRRLCMEELGWTRERANLHVRSEYVGLNVERRKIYRYVISEDVKRLHRRLRNEAAAAAASPQERPANEIATRAAEREHAAFREAIDGGQGALFDNRPLPSQHRQRA